ncbi:hypothetical protein IV102_08295 [bacterium]|nr:hypothetical protein [bacterium]
MLSMATLGLPSRTPLSSFNSWALSLAAHRSGEMETAALEQEFARLALEMSQISAVFRSEVRYQERQPPWDRVLDAALAQLERCEDLFYLLQEAAGLGAWEQIDQAQVERLGAALTALFESFKEVSALESQRPQLASSPYVHELLRCLQLHQGGGLSRELVEERLASVSQHFLQLQAQLESTPLRLPAVDQLLETLEVQQIAFDELSSALQSGHPVPARLTYVLRDCAEEARAIHQEILDMQGTDAAWCLACEGIVVVNAGVCSECGAALGGDQVDQGVLGLVELANQAYHHNQPQDWELLETRVAQSLSQLGEVLAKARSLPQPPPQVEAALSGLQQVLVEIQGCATQRDGAGLRGHILGLEQSLAAAQEAQSEASKEMST